jgi:16S rRNA (cytidine1402-2'-O)-methyltransferase
MPGTLFVVATPIGNLEDITLRALRVLREADLIAAEDTRRTARLLQHYSIGTPTTSLHEHNEAQRSAALLDRLRAGASVALVSDAGTPLVSDPGAKLVRAARAEGIPVVPIPGPSAIMTLMAAIGLPEDEFTFLGFPPSRSNARKKWLADVVAKAGHTVVVFEAPHRVRHLLSDALAVLGDRPIWVGRELTKIHEELVVRPISEHLRHYEEPRGEFTLAIPPPSAEGLPPAKPDRAMLRHEFGELTQNVLSSKRRAVAELASRHGLSTNEVYRLLSSERD